MQYLGFLLLYLIVNQYQNEIDYEKLPGKHLSHDEVQVFLEHLDSEYELESNFYYSFYRFKNGVELQCTSTDTLIGIVFSKGKLDKNVQLPYNIQTSDLLKDIELKIGKPDKFCTYSSRSKAYYFSKNLTVFYETSDYKDKNAAASAFIVEKDLDKVAFNPYSCISCK